MDPAIGAADAPDQKYGVCHRCGWKGPVAKVGRRQRRRLNTGRTYGRLCDNCVNDILHKGTSPADEKKTARLKSIRSRKVA